MVFGEEHIDVRRCYTRLYRTQDTSPGGRPLWSDFDVRVLSNMGATTKHLDITFNSHRHSITRLKSFLDNRDVRATDPCAVDREFYRGFNPPL